MNIDILSGFAIVVFTLSISYCTTLLNCDLQHMLTNNAYARHLILLVSLFFVVAAFFPNQSIVDSWFQSVLVYLVFLLGSKSTIIPIVITIILLIVDQNLRIQINYLQSKDPNTDVSTLKTIRTYILYAAIAVVLLGVAFYYVKKQNDYGDQFSTSTFFFGTNVCRSLQKPMA